MLKPYCVLLFEKSNLFKTINLFMKPNMQLSTYVKNGNVPVVHGTSCPTFGKA